MFPSSGYIDNHQSIDSDAGWAPRRLCMTGAPAGASTAGHPRLEVPPRGDASQKRS
jgi:hypothetical protein